VEFFVVFFAFICFCHEKARAQVRLIFQLSRKGRKIDVV
jgi:hypothetical protein